jgi:uncharacterized UPF0160 family protein
MSSQNEFTIGTHSGFYHLDDVLASVILTKVFPGAKVLRSNELAVHEAAHCSVVYDVGMVYDHSRKLYDHHQMGYNETMGPSRFADIKLCAVGLIWKHYGETYLAQVWPPQAKEKSTIPNVEKIFWRVYEGFIAAIDVNDNGLSSKLGMLRDETSLYERTKRMNSEGRTFENAMHLVNTEFVAYINHLIMHWLPSFAIVHEAFCKRVADADPSGKIVVIYAARVNGAEEHVRYLEQLYNVKEPVLYTVKFDQSRNQWVSFAVAKSDTTLECRKPFPATWRGLSDAALSKVTGIEGCRFVHANGFLAAHADLDGIMRMVRLALEMV